MCISCQILIKTQLWRWRSNSMQLRDYSERTAHLNVLRGTLYIWLAVARSCKRKEGQAHVPALLIKRDSRFVVLPSPVLHVYIRAQLQIVCQVPASMIWIRID